MLLQRQRYKIDTHTGYRIGTLAILVSLLLLTGCSKSNQSANNGKRGGDKPHIVETAIVKRLPVSRTVVRTGTLAARKVTKLFNQEEGTVKSITVYEGDHVTKGKLLVKLDDRRLRADLEKAVANRKKAKRDNNRMKKLSRDSVTSKEMVQETKTLLNIAHADEQIALIRVEDAEIHAPYAGIIAERNVEEGDVVPRYTHLLTILDQSTLYTEVSLSELLISTLVVGDKAEVKVDALPGVTMLGVISRIHPTVDPRTRQGIVEVQLTDIPGGTTTGQLCRVTIRTPETPRLVIPYAAMRQDTNGTFVFLVEDDTVERRAIHPGLNFDDQVEILEGLQEGATVVSRGFLGITAGKKVEESQPSPVKERE